MKTLKLFVFMTSFLLIGLFSQSAFSQSENPKTRKDVISAFESGNFDLSGWDLSGANLGETSFRDVLVGSFVTLTLFTTWGFVYTKSLDVILPGVMSNIMMNNYMSLSNFFIVSPLLVIGGAIPCVGVICAWGFIPESYYIGREIDLRQANLKDAIYDDKTKFPKGFNSESLFNPESMGMIPKCKTAFLKP